MSLTCVLGRPRVAPISAKSWPVSTNLGRSRPKSGQIQAELAQTVLLVRPIFVRVRSSLARVRPNSGDGGGTRAKFVPSSANIGRFGPNLVRFKRGSHSAKIGRSRPTSGRHCGRARPTLGDFHPNRPEFGQCWPEFDHIRAMPAEVGPDLARNRTRCGDFGRSWPKWGQFSMRESCSSPY